MPLINYQKNIGEALKIINNKKLGIIVVEKNRHIEGIITDGDLRRELKSLSKKPKFKK